MQKEHSLSRGQWKESKKMGRAEQVIKLVQKLHSYSAELYFLWVHDPKITWHEGMPWSKASCSVVAKSIFKWFMGCYFGPELSLKGSTQAAAWMLKMIHSYVWITSPHTLSETRLESWHFYSTEWFSGEGLGRKKRSLLRLSLSTCSGMTFGKILQGPTFQ